MLPHFHYISITPLFWNRRHTQFLSEGTTSKLKPSLLPCAVSAPSSLSYSTPSLFCPSFRLSDITPQLRPSEFWHIYYIYLVHASVTIIIICTSKPIKPVPRVRVFPGLWPANPHPHPWLPVTVTRRVPYQEIWDPDLTIWRSLSCQKVPSQETCRWSKPLYGLVSRVQQS